MECGSSEAHKAMAGRDLPYVRWTKEVQNALLRNVQQREYEVLWRSSHPQANDAEAVDAKCQHLCQTLRGIYPELKYLTPDHVKIRLKYFRQQYERELIRLYNTPDRAAFNAVGLPVPKWEYFDLCSFMQGEFKALLSVKDEAGEEQGGEEQLPGVEVYIKTELLDSDEPSDLAATTDLCFVPWNRDSILALIREIRKIDILWNFRQPPKELKDIRKKFYTQIAKYLRKKFPELRLITEDHVEYKFNYFRCRFERELRRLSGEDGKQKDISEWEFFKYCYFLRTVADDGTLTQETSSQATCNVEMQMRFEGEEVGEIKVEEETECSLGGGGEIFHASRLTPSPSSSLPSPTFFSQLTPPSTCPSTHSTSSPTQQPSGSTSVSSPTHPTLHHKKRSSEEEDESNKRKCNDSMKHKEKCEDVDKYVDVRRGGEGSKRDSTSRKLGTIVEYTCSELSPPMQARFWRDVMAFIANWQLENSE